MKKVSADPIVVDLPPGPFANILRAIAKSLIHAANDGASTIAPAFSYAAVEPIAPAAGEFDAKNADIGARHESMCQRIAQARRGIDDQGAWVGGGDETVPSAQQAHPGSPGLITGRDNQIRQGRVEGAMFVGQMVA